MSNTGRGYLAFRRKAAEIGLLPALTLDQEQGLLKKKRLETALEKAPHPGRMKRGGATRAMIASARAHECQMATSEKEESD